MIKKLYITKTGRPVIDPGAKEIRKLGWKSGQELMIDVDFRGKGKITIEPLN